MSMEGSMASSCQGTADMKPLDSVGVLVDKDDRSGACLESAEDRPNVTSYYTVLASFSGRSGGWARHLGILSVVQ